MFIEIHWLIILSLLALMGVVTLMVGISSIIAMTLSHFIKIDE